MYYIASLIFLEILLFATNYTSGTFLIGWDNVMPEFNLNLNLERALTSLWQEYRGLGLVDGLAHSANLFHTIYISLLSIFLPQSVVRYVFIHLTHLAGGIAFFLLVSSLVKNKKASFFGSLLYMFNLGVIQMYYAPLEVFAVHFAALPLIALLLINVLRHPSKKNIILLLTGSIFTTPQAFVPTVFLASCILLFFILFFFYLTQRNLKRTVLVGFLIFSANAFWLLPYLYSATYTPPVIANARINQFSSEEIFYRNKARGDLASVIFLKGFMIDNVEYDTKAQAYVYFMDPWRNHQNSIIYTVLFLSVIGITTLGVVRTLKNKQQHFLPYLLSGFVAFFFLANDTPLLAGFNNLIRLVFPLFGEAFRFPFTKFITLFAFCFSIFFSYGIALCLQLFRKSERVMLLVMVLTFTYLFYPAFRGYFTSPMLRLKLPNDYLLTFNYVKTLDTGKRIAIFPVHTFWNWQYRSFGHRGSGFLWYGIKQPILERAFDPWSNYNEQFYNEISYAVNSENSTLFTNTIKKYDIGYILLDEYIVDTTGNHLINYSRIKRLLEADLISKKKTFGKITIYEVKDVHESVYGLDATKTKKISSDFFFDNEDAIFANHGNYIVDKKNPNSTYPFASLYTERLQEDIPFSVQNTNLHLMLIKKLENFPRKNAYILKLPSIFTNEFLIPIDISMSNRSLILTPIYPKITIDNIPIEVEKNSLVFNPTVVQNPTTITFVDIEHTISLTSPQQKSYLLNKYPNVLRLRDDKNEELLVVDTRTAPQIRTQRIVLDKSPSVIKVAVEKIDNPFNLENVITKKLYTVKSPNEGGGLNPFISGYALTDTDKKTGNVTFEAKSDAKELTFYKDNLFHQGSYLILVNAKYNSGLPINFYIDNPFENRVELESRLSKTNKENIFILPPRQDYFKGYGFHFIVKSVGKEVAKSIIETIDLYPIPWKTIKNIRIDIDNKPVASTRSEKLPIESKKLATFLYEVTAPNQQAYIVLSQSFNPGWKAYKVSNDNLFTSIFPFLFGEDIKNHILVNNWANGWVLPATSNKQQATSIHIVFLPQYLQYLGFVLLFGTFGWLFIAALPRKTPWRDPHKNPLTQKKRGCSRAYEV